MISFWCIFSSRNLLLLRIYSKHSLNTAFSVYVFSAPCTLFRAVGFVLCFFSLFGTKVPAVQHGTSGFSKTPRGLLIENFLAHADPTSLDLNGPPKVCWWLPLLPRIVYIYMKLADWLSSSP